MKFSLLAFALFSTTVYAIGTSELSGSFELTLDAPSSPTSHEATDKTRSPATEVEGKKLPHVSELSGTFK